jgi:hypothetical protein
MTCGGGGSGTSYEQPTGGVLLIKAQATPIPAVPPVATRVQALQKPFTHWHSRLPFRQVELVGIVEIRL